jgi:hypothetical protein
MDVAAAFRTVLVREARLFLARATTWRHETVPNMGVIMRPCETDDGAG